MLFGEIVVKAPNFLCSKSSTLCVIMTELSVCWPFFTLYRHYKQYVFPSTTANKSGPLRRSLPAKGSFSWHIATTLQLREISLQSDGLLAQRKLNMYIYSIYLQKRDEDLVFSPSLLIWVLRHRLFGKLRPALRIQLHLVLYKVFLSSQRHHWAFYPRC